MNEQLKVDILELANALMALPKKEQDAIINRAYGMCMYALAVNPVNANKNTASRPQAPPGAGGTYGRTAY